MQFRKFTKIPQLKSVVRNMDSEVSITGRVKIHGTNAAICFNENNDIWFQSRNQMLSENDSHSHFPLVFTEKQVNFMPYFNRIKKELKINFPEYKCYIYGEWAGPGVIRKNKTAIKSLKTKKFFAFAVFVVVPSSNTVNDSLLTKIKDKDDKDDNDETTTYFTYDFTTDDKENDIYNINNFKTWKLKFPKAQFKFKVEDLIEITNAVENQCPVGEYFDISGIGEGVVWSDKSGNIFKVKGKKHSDTKVKTLTSVDTIKLGSIKQFVEYSVTKNRVDQAVREVWPDGNVDKLKIKDFISWMITDVLKEESDVLEKSNLTPKDVSKYIIGEAKDILFNYYIDNIC